MNDKDMKTVIGLFIIAIWGLFMLIIPLYSIIPLIYYNCLYAAAIIMFLSSLSISYLIGKK